MSRQHARTRDPRSTLPTWTWGARRAPLGVVFALCALSWALPCAADQGAGSATVFVRADTDRTVVISPRTGTQVRFNEDRTTLSGSYTADVWTSASIDIRTAASEVITEQRDQIDFAASHELDDVTIGGSYYYSGENDYWSHGFTLRSVQEVFGGSSTFEESVRYVHDLVGRAGDDIERPLDSVSLRAVYTQIFGPEAIAQLVWEGTYRTGFQSSPYRFVGLGGDGQCVPNPDGDPGDGIDDGGRATLCLPESHPSTRIRNAFMARARYAFSRDTSAGLGYRFYFDDWGLTSHTATVQIGWVPAEDQVLTLRYRFYSQTAAAFYLSRYPEPSGQVNFITRDRELSPMLSNRVAIAYQGRAQLADEVSLRMAIAVGASVFVYADFVGLSEVYSLDGTVSFTLEL